MTTDAQLAHTEQLAIIYAPTPDRRMRVGRLAIKNREILFEYDGAFLDTKLDLSPLRLPFSTGVFVGRRDLLDGLPGVLDDSLPDGWGRLLIDRRAAALGLSAAVLSPLDRLALVGARAMGALTYEPETAIEAPTLVKLSELARESEAVLDGAGDADLEQLIAVGGSPQGARPKVLVQLSPRGDVRFGARTIEPGFTAWLVKFRARADDRHSAALEHAYALMAAAAGIDMPRTQVLGTTSREPGYFATERFDRVGTARRHVHTLGGLLHLPHAYFALDYRDVLEVARRLTRDESAVAELFRRACFNVFARNRDDHTRNFAFVMDERGRWRPSPAYDLTFANGPGGEHSMLVAGEAREPTREHLLRLGSDGGLKRPAAIVDEVRAAVNRFATFADGAGVPARLRATVAAALGVPAKQSVSGRRARSSSRPSPSRRR